MALQSKYEQFLAAPKAEALASNASIHYIPTLCTITEPAPILKHLSAQDQQLKKEEEKFVHVVGGDHKLCVETETTLEFLFGGGTYLPGMDDNFLTDRKVTLPIVSIIVRQEPRKRLTGFLIDSHRRLRQRRQNSTDSTIMGPGWSAKISRCHRLSWSKLANSRCQGAIPLDLIFDCRRTHTRFTALHSWR